MPSNFSNLKRRCGIYATHLCFSLSKVHNFCLLGTLQVLFCSKSMDEGHACGDVPAVQDSELALGEHMALARSQISVLSVSYA